MKLSKSVLSTLVLSTLMIGSAFARPVIRPNPRPVPRPAPRPIPLPGPVFGQQQVKIQVNQQFQGRGTLFLKQLIQRQHPRLNLQRLRLSRVLLVAKSQMGRGTAALEIGGRRGYAETIPGSPQLYHFPGLRTFHRVGLSAPHVGPQGPMTTWQVELSGNVKVQEVVVTLEGARRRGRGL